MNDISDREQVLADEMTGLLRAKMEKDYAQGATQRDAHPKCLGLLKAELIVDDDLPEAARVGVFDSPGRYPAFIRFSNASGSVQSDSEKDFRGIAIKLIGVSGQRHSDDEHSSQDFLLMNHPTMPFGTPKLFRDVVYYSVKWGPLAMLLRLLLGGHLSALRTVSAGRSNPASLLEETYWSTTPYTFGDTSAKYQLRPTSDSRQSVPTELTENYLTQELTEHLKTAEVTYELGVQYFVDNTLTPIEDAAVEWTEENSPFVRIARLEIPHQTVATKNRFDLAERLSFSPNHALAVHAPLGGLNRVRGVLYRKLSEFRHQRDANPLIEPNEKTYIDLA